MRLVHVVPTYLPARRYGGPIFAIHGLCRALAARGHAVEVFTTSIDGPQNSPVPYDEPVMIDGVKIRYFASNVLRRLAYAPAMGPALAREIPGADIVHLHSVFLWPTWAAARRARRGGIRYLISPRGMLVRKLIDEHNRLLKTAWIAAIERTNIERAAAVHVTSAIEAAELQKLGFRLRRLDVVANGVEQLEARPAGRPAADIQALMDEQPLILFLGRLSWVKGLDRLLREFAHTRSGTLAIVGTDYDRLASRLLQLAHELNIADRVMIVPRTVTGVDKEAAFAAARMLVLPSYSESFGNSALEAMQRGLPVIVTEGVGAADVVRAAHCGLVVDDRPTMLGAAIERLTTDPVSARAMGEKGRAYVREHCSWATIAAQMEDLYASLCS